MRRGPCSVPGSALVLTVLVGLALSACSSGGPARPVPTGSLQALAARPSVGPAEVAREAPAPAPAATGTLVAPPASRFVELRHHPWGAPYEVLDTMNAFNELVVMPVLDGPITKGGARWLRVRLPNRPNESSAWVRRGDFGTLRTLHDRLVVDLSTYKLSWFRDGKLRERFPVGVGNSWTPTPTGTFYVWGHAPQPSPSGPYGVFALGLTGFSPVLTDWLGGGRIAIHGTPRPYDVGHPVSHGCIRVYNPNMSTLTKLPLGTPVVVQK